MTVVDSREEAHGSSSSMVAAAHRGGLEVIERWADAWRVLCDEAVDGQPFYRPEWIAAHIRAFTPHAKVVLLTVTSAGKLLFILPLLEEMALKEMLRYPQRGTTCRTFGAGICLRFRTCSKAELSPLWPLPPGRIIFMRFRFRTSPILMFQSRRTRRA